jgi:hypothetical protein
MSPEDRPSLTVAGAEGDRPARGVRSARRRRKKTEAKDAGAEISKAPAPITPAQGRMHRWCLTGNDDVPKNMTYEDWKALRKAGKIKLRRLCVALTREIRRILSA